MKCVLVFCDHVLSLYETLRQGRRGAARLFCS